MYYSKGSSIILFFIFVMMQFDAISQGDTVVSINKDASSIYNANTLLSPVFSVNDKMDFKTVESVSYSLYFQKDWKTLCTYGEKAIRLKFDYYYIRVRLGIAYFELKQYRSAIAHFKKALSFNEGDDFVTSYLYSCYLYAERFEDAKKLTKSFSPVLAEVMKSKDFSAIDYILVEGGYKFTQNLNFKNPLFLNLGMAHSIARTVFLFHNFTYFTQDESRFSVNQFQYYLRGSIPLKKNLFLSAGFHLVNVNSVYKEYDYIVRPGPHGPGSPTETFTVVNESTPTAAYNTIGAISLTKRLPYFDLSIGTTAAKFDTASQYQVNAGLAFYPLKNNKFSVGANVYYHYENYKEGSSGSVAFTPFLNAYLSSRIHVSVSYFKNKGPNITEATGYFVSNSIDYTTERWAFTGSVKVNSTVWVYGTYGYESKEYNKPEPGNFRYYYHIFSFGLKIYPQFK